MFAAALVSRDAALSHVQDSGVRCPMSTARFIEEIAAMPAPVSGNRLALF
jgi:hypothetical protein